MYPPLSEYDVIRGGWPVGRAALQRFPGQPSPRGEGFYKGVGVPDRLELPETLDRFFLLRSVPLEEVLLLELVVSLSDGV